jgi:hypothetical protein
MDLGATTARAPPPLGEMVDGNRLAMAGQGEAWLVGPGRSWLWL